jgi:hypothetical protein
MQKSMLPFNVSILHLTPPKLAGLAQITSLSMYEGITNNFHPDGLFSTKIFGRVGDDVRARRYAYIDIKVAVFHPIIYNTLVSLKRLYGGIMSGHEYAVWNPEKKDFDRSDAMDGETGYHFFMTYWEQIDFAKTSSDKRDIAIRLIEKYKKQALTSKIIVIPAGLRDVEIGGDGRPREDEINPIYRELLSTANTLSDIAIRSTPELIDRARFKLQTTFVKIYDLIERLIYGKNKLIQGKWASRRIMNGTGNVITALPVETQYLGAAGAAGFNDTAIGLFQLIKGLLPIALYQLKHGWLRQVFPDYSLPVNLVNKKTLKAEPVSLKTEYYDRFQTNEGLEKVVNAFREESLRDQPMELEGRYMGLIYKGPDNTFKIFNDIDELPANRSREHVYPLTFCELVYLSGYRMWNKYPATVTRYPVTGVGSIYPTSLYVRTTTVAECRKELGRNWEPLDDSHTAYEFPVPGPYMKSMSPHPTRLAKLDADFDGDMMNCNIVYSDEAVEEVNNYFGKRRAYVGTNGQFISSTAVHTAKLVFHNLTGD